MYNLFFPLYYLNEVWSKSGFTLTFVCFLPLYLIGGGLILSTLSLFLLFENKYVQQKSEFILIVTITFDMLESACKNFFDAVFWNEEMPLRELSHIKNDC